MKRFEWNRGLSARLGTAALLVFLALGTGLWGCGSEREADVPPTTGAVEPPPPPPPPAPPTADEGSSGTAAQKAAAARDAGSAPISEDDEDLREALNELRSSDPEVRADAVYDIEPEGVGLRYLIDTLSDPDPEVRISVISQLEDADEEPEAIAGLVTALGDEDPEVVIEAIDAIEFVGDSSQIRDLQRYADHPNEEVREAVADAIEYLEDE
ncbi:MAG: HEAT repeat domain-containing protein [Gemmatimonadota bacterium]|nr:HEAT repeat domain-containing protein [Gemmatimonadota bacterium]